VVTLLGLVVVVMLLVGMPGVVDLRDVDKGESVQVASETAPSVAERAAEAILAYSHEQLDADKAGAQQFMTSEFAEEYASTFDKTVAPAARTYKATVTAEVKGSSVVRAAEDRVAVLLFVDQTTRSTAHQRPQVALNRVEMVMVRVDGEWLVDDISSY
jgi:Mce-associated membrane protein